MAGNDIFGAFGRRRANMTPTIPLRQQLQADAGVEPPKIGGTEPVRRVGMFGRMFGKDLPRTLQIFAAGMRDISDPSANAVNQFSANEAEQQAREMAMRAYEQRSMNDKQDREVAMQDREIERAAAEAAARRRAQIDEIIATLPPDQQALALMNSEGYVSGMMRHLYPGPQSGPLVQYVYPGGADDDGGGWNAGPPPQGGRR